MIKNLPANAGDISNTGSIPESGRSPGGGHGNTLQFLPGESPWTEEPGELQSMGLQRVRHKRSKRACMHAHSRVPRTQQKLQQGELAGSAGVN